MVTGGTVRKRSAAFGHTEAEASQLMAAAEATPEVLQEIERSTGQAWSALTPRARFQAVLDLQERGRIARSLLRDVKDIQRSERRSDP
jgi:hypothetical protein